MAEWTRGRCGRSLLSLIVCLIASAGAAQAHPLGNFTINHLAKIEAVRRTLHVRYVLDIAEIPTFQIMQARAHDGTWDRAQLSAWATTEVPVVTGALHITVDGVPALLTEQRVRARLRPGAGGLPILYWVADFTAPFGAGAHRVDVQDRVYRERRIGWKDVVVAPDSEPTHELLSYPNVLIESPRRIDGVTFTLSAAGRPGALLTHTDELPDINGSASIVRGNALSNMFADTNRALPFVLLTMLVAFGLGALHALEPGHGKAVLAFTLVGSRATAKQAAILAGALTFSHTIGVALLGAVLFAASDFVSESVYPWITLLSGAVIAVIGVRKVAAYLHSHDVFGARTAGVHHHAGHVHHHGDGDHEHTHVIPGSSPITFGGAVAAAMSGGAAPCPAAIVVMLAALRLHQIGYGLVLIVLFSLGLASVLTALGIAIVHGSGLLVRSEKLREVTAAGPLISAVVISLAGALMIGQGFVAQGLNVPVWVVAGLVVLAGAGYALTPQHTHVHGVQEA
jgi:nickel/cobalt exporter